jgi:hypothetical protein
MPLLARIFWFEESMTTVILAVNEGKDLLPIFNNKEQTSHGFSMVLKLLQERVSVKPSKISAPEEQEMEL